ncbi:MAG: hypothetical protein NT075_09305 [Chloroflexi bacterium]|nr:hypothetical protein [Chloroflexota bacterium]
MPTTSQMLAEYPDILLQVLAELRGAFLDGADTHEQAVDLLAAQITDPTSVQFAYQEVIDMADPAKGAIETLLKEGGEMVEAQFSREFGSIRQMGPAKLERESPWLYPESVSELLYYYGLVGRGFKGAGKNAHTIIYLPNDVTPWLPHPQNPVLASGLPIQPVPPPSAARTLPADDSFLEDMGTFLGFLHADQLRLTAKGPNPEDIDRFVQRLQIPFSGDEPELNTRLALLLHLANRLGWLRRGDNDLVQLTGNRVRLFLDKTRAEQRFALWEAWRNSPDWNDLCHTPGLECTNTNNWKNDPRQTRETLLGIFAKLQPGAWYSRYDILRTIKTTEPDFQRPTGDYDSWYIRSTTTQEFLKGFEHWDQVEGALIRFLISGPLHWLSAQDLAEPSAGDDLLVSLSHWGAIWLGHDVPQPHEQLRRTITVGEDFTLTLLPGASLADRFRVERFAQWQASYPNYIYQISQRSLKRATEGSITPQQILSFLRERSPEIPAKVLTALERLSNPERAK